MQANRAKLPHREIDRKIVELKRIEKKPTKTKQNKQQNQKTSIRDATTSFKLVQMSES